MTTTNQTVYVSYTAPATGTRPNIAFFSDQACTQAWVATAIPAGDSTNYTLQPGKTGSSFTFAGITFWAKDAGGILASQVARSFQETQSGVANFNGQEVVTKINVQKKSSITFTVTNKNGPGQRGFVSFQVTLEDKGLKELFTSVDPQITLEKPPG